MARLKVRFGQFNLVETNILDVMHKGTIAIFTSHVSLIPLGGCKTKADQKLDAIHLV